MPRNTQKLRAALAAVIDALLLSKQRGTSPVLVLEKPVYNKLKRQRKLKNSETEQLRKHIVQLLEQTSALLRRYELRDLAAIADLRGLGFRESLMYLGESYGHLPRTSELQIRMMTPDEGGK